MAPIRTGWGPNPGLLGKINQDRCVMTIRAAFDSRYWRTSTALALGFALAFLSTSPLLAGEGVFTPHHLARLRTVTAAAISPDGTQGGRL